VRNEGFDRLGLAGTVCAYKHNAMKAKEKGRRPKMRAHPYQESVNKGSESCNQSINLAEI